MSNKQFKPKIHKRYAMLQIGFSSFVLLAIIFALSIAYPLYISNGRSWSITGYDTSMHAFLPNVSNGLQVSYAASAIIVALIGILGIIIAIVQIVNVLRLKSRRGLISGILSLLVVTRVIAFFMNINICRRKI